MDLLFTMQNNTIIMIGGVCSMHWKIKNKSLKFCLLNFNVREYAVKVGVDERSLTNIV
jgi:predicted RNA-binding protein associated with RNAse of E/G family